MDTWDVCLNQQTEPVGEEVTLRCHEKRYARRVAVYRSGVDGDFTLSMKEVRVLAVG